MKAQILMAMLFISLCASAQTETQGDWESWLGDLMADEDLESAEWEDTYETLCELAQHRMDLNKATGEDLEALPFLSAQQVEDIMEYLYRYGPMKSANELLMIRSLDYERRRLLCCFVFVGEEMDSPDKPSLGQMLRHGRSELVATVRIPFYERAGDKNGYLGYPYRHWLRYLFSYGSQLKAGVVGAQDAGEPFFSNKNRMGYDFYSAFLQLKQFGRLETLVVGRYRASAGMGLIVNNSFSLGKLSLLQNLGRSASGLRAHSSRSAADYLNGVGATVTIAKNLSATAYFSYRSQDATLNKDGTVSTILTSGYHRTSKEMEKKDNLKNTTMGGGLAYHAGGFHAGLNAVGIHLNRELRPNTNVLYRRYYARGYDFLNFSADYGYAHPHFAFNGETAMNKEGALATINSLSMRVGSEWSIMAVGRFYSYRYTSLYARCFSDGGKVQNESGLYLGATWQPSPRWKLTAYTDYAYFPWVKYQVSQSSHSWDNFLQVSYSRSKWDLSGRYRLRVRQRDYESSLIDRTEHRGRLTAQYGGSWSSRTQLDFSMTRSIDSEVGYMLSQSFSYSRGWLRLNGGAGFFRTDSYEAVYESSGRDRRDPAPSCRRTYLGIYRRPGHHGRGRLCLLPRPGQENDRKFRLQYLPGTDGKYPRRKQDGIHELRNRSSGFLQDAEGKGIRCA